MASTTVEGDSVKVPLVLGPYEAKVVVVGPLPKVVAAAEPSFVSGDTVADLSGDWKLDLNGKQLTTPIKPWEEWARRRLPGRRRTACSSPQHDSQGEACVSGDRRCA